MINDNFDFKKLLKESIQEREGLKNEVVDLPMELPKEAHEAAKVEIIAAVADFGKIPEITKKGKKDPFIAKAIERWVPARTNADARGDVIKALAHFVPKYLEKLEMDSEEGEEGEEGEDSEEGEPVPGGKKAELRKNHDQFKKAQNFFIKKAKELGVSADVIGDYNVITSKFIDTVFKADYERTGGRIDEAVEKEITTSELIVLFERELTQWK